MKRELSLGRLLRGVRAGERHLAWNHESTRCAAQCISLGSADFDDGAAMPLRSAGPGVGDNLSPELHWSGVPEEAKELVLVLEDASVPLPRPYVHLVARGIDPSMAGLPEGALSAENAHLYGILLGKGSGGRIGYGGPRALRGHGPHAYHFELFALARKLENLETLALPSLLESVEDQVIAKGRLLGFFEQGKIAHE
jgi:Raf kinase inhibitor-like YbhB/YbcL family protein